MDDQKLGRYIESLYETREESYRVTAHSSESFFQVTVEHDRKKGPDLEKLKKRLDNDLALSEIWQLEIEEGENCSTLYGYEEFAEL